MTTEECTKILAKYAALYPNFTPSEPFFLAYAEFFENYNVKDFEEALHSIVAQAESRFFPTAPEIVAKLDEQNRRRNAEAVAKAAFENSRYALPAPTPSLAEPEKPREPKPPGWLMKLFYEKRDEVRRKKLEAA